MLSASGRSAAYDVFDVAATTMPRSGNVRNDVEAPSRLRLAWLARRVDSPASGTLSSIHPSPYAVSLPDVSNCGVWSRLMVAGCSSLPFIIASPNRTRSVGVDRKPPAPAKQE